jgi:arylsulfatase A-like enzyme
VPIVEYEASAGFPGVIGRTTDESSPAWPAPVRAKQGAPNVLYIVLDDTGFGQLGCFGSPIQTPNLDGIAANGLRYNNMHTTALCSPSRSCILTGRNHHANGMAAITELASGYPGYNGVVPFENGFLSEMLIEHGYNTYMVGKWHLTPSNQETAAGPYTRWPLARGFERFYGFLGGDTSQWYPDLVYDNHQVEPPATPEEGYHLSEDLVDKAIEFIADAKQIDPDKPFYLHLCFGATHAPHHVPKEWADRYKGAFDEGWDAYRETTFARQKELGIVPAEAELSRHDPDVPEWASLPAPARQLFARMMEVFAGFLTHSDHQVGRLLEFLTKIDALENTLIMVISDNGASAEGGPPGQRMRRSSSTTPKNRSRTASRPSTSSAAPTTSTTIRGVGPGRATRRSAAGSARPTAGGRPTRSSSPGPGESRPGASSAATTRTSLTWCPPPWSCWGCRRRQPSGASPRHRCTG